METLKIPTRKQFEFVNITNQVKKIVADANIEEGTCTVYSPHTTAGITINEAADPSVTKDILKELDELVPLRHNYSHSEGNSAAHIKTSLVGSGQVIPIHKGNLILGTWQGIFFCEFDGPRQRKAHVTVTSS